MKKVLIVINDLFEEMETLAPFDVLKRAGINVDIAAKKECVVGAHGITLSNLKDYKTLNLEEYDMVILPGGPQYKENQKDSTYINIIKYFIENKALACICATPTILGDLGLLKNKTYTLFPPMNREFNGTFTSSPCEIYGNLITGRSAGSSLEFSYKILEYLLGNEKVNEIKASMYY